MDELDLLKKDWNKNNHAKVSKEQIDGMMTKKSASIVKWIFIIGVVEFLAWGVLSLLMKDNDIIKRLDHLNHNTIFIVLSIANVIVLVYFLYLFFRNYKSISTTDSTKALMENIIKTRKTVKYYVAFNVLFLIIAVLVGLQSQIHTHPDLGSQLAQAKADGHLLVFYGKIIALASITLIVAIGLLLLFYWLIYGILLGRLNKNYNELKKLDL